MKLRLNKNIFLLVLIATSLEAAPILQMNQALRALSELMPFLGDEKLFENSSNDKVIVENIQNIKEAFRNSKHEALLKQDLFAPSYAVVTESLSGSLDAFKKGDKDFARWRLKELTTHCLDCHTRLPVAHSSSFQTGDLQLELSKFPNKYNLVIAQLIVRRYPDAKTTFNMYIAQQMIKQDFRDLENPFKQLLMIETKVSKTPGNMILVADGYLQKKDLPDSIKVMLRSWNESLKSWVNNPYLSGLKSEQQVREIVKSKHIPVRQNFTFSEQSEVDFLMLSGLLSNFLFENPETTLATEINFWVGWMEKYLKRENFFGSGDLFLKQCIRRYPQSPVARDCLKEYRESVEFDFTGTRGTDIPSDVKAELKELEDLLKKKK